MSNHRYVDTNERLPKKDGLYIVDLNEVVQWASFSDGVFLDDDGGIIEPQYWLEVDIPPKVDVNDMEAVLIRKLFGV